MTCRPMWWIIARDWLSDQVARVVAWQLRRNADKINDGP